MAYVHELDAASVLSQTGLPEPQLHRTRHDEVIRIGEQVIRVLHTPGHTPGSQSLVLESYRPWRVLTGDTMFIGSYGRCVSACGR